MTGDEFRDHLQNVTSKLSQIKMDLVDSLQSTFVIYDSDIDKVTSWYVEILGIKEKVEDLKTKFHDDVRKIICLLNIKHVDQMLKIIIYLEKSTNSGYGRH